MIRLRLRSSLQSNNEIILNSLNKDKPKVFGDCDMDPTVIEFAIFSDTMALGINQSLNPKLVFKKLFSFILEAPSADSLSFWLLLYLTVFQ